MLWISGELGDRDFANIMTRNKGKLTTNKRNIYFRKKLE